MKVRDPSLFPSTPIWNFQVKFITVIARSLSPSALIRGGGTIVGRHPTVSNINFHSWNIRRTWIQWIRCETMNVLFCVCSTTITKGGNYNIYFFFSITNYKHANAKLYFPFFFFFHRLVPPWGWKYLNPSKFLSNPLRFNNYWLEDFRLTSDSKSMPPPRQPPFSFVHYPLGKMLKMKLRWNRF